MCLTWLHMLKDRFSHGMAQMCLFDNQSPKISQQGLSGWLGRAMVLGSFKCRSVLLLWHMVGQGFAVLEAGAGWVGYVLLFFNLVYPLFLF